MKNKIIQRIAIVFLLIVLVSAGVGEYNKRSKNAITINEPQQIILDERDLSNPTISKLICVDNVCRSCARKGDYGMGCIKINKIYCSEYNETLNECLSFTDYTLVELENNEALAYKKRWEGIADDIVDRENRVYDVKLDEGNIIIGK